MEKDAIHLSDWGRILVGEVPGIFYLEILLRAATIYLILVVSMRLMGRRMASQLSRNEMAALISLAAAIGVPILDPGRGLLPAVIIALVVIFIQRLISYWAARNEKFEGISQDISSVMVENAVLQLENMKESRITRDLLFAQLRSTGVLQLGSVKRLYIEANGSFTLIQRPESQPGLSILPEWDSEFIAKQKPVTDRYVCYWCGHDQPAGTGDSVRCPNCKKQEWVQAIRG
ncbi:DUF421 domain-containing protein [Larkinella terrae]|uniref:DUF421 domain-containing protein n=1 Tax=Larkinella terrae TaxID=2025311 RepID=A0A7K0EF21_9BACT|nr:YetF domain-containing protein [Larkinella terrae]MRS60345.1 DUF421 domain-containing protein [Larkinella terrae]